MPDPKTDQTPSSTTSTSDAGEKQASRTTRAANPEGGLKAEVQAMHEARTVVPSVPEADARLDNRSAAQLASEDKPKPQHVDGPDVAGQAAHTRATLANRKSKG